jgi:hypothetical protein
MGRAYGGHVVVDTLMPGFAAVAGALGIRNIGLARIAACNLRLPDLPDTVGWIGVEAEDLVIKLERLDEQLARIAGDAAQRPRTGAPPNPGWFAPRNGSSADPVPPQVAANEREERRPGGRVRSAG